MDERRATSHARRRGLSDVSRRTIIPVVGTAAITLSAATRAWSQPAVGDLRSAPAAATSGELPVSVEFDGEGWLPGVDGSDVRVPLTIIVRNPTGVDLHGLALATTFPVYATGSPEIAGVVVADAVEAVEDDDVVQTRLLRLPDLPAGRTLRVPVVIPPTVRPPSAATSITAVFVGGAASATLRPFELRASPRSTVWPTRLRLDGTATTAVAGCGEWSHPAALEVTNIGTRTIPAGSLRIRQHLSADQQDPVPDSFDTRNVLLDGASVYRAVSSCIRSGTWYSNYERVVLVDLEPGAVLRLGIDPQSCRSGRSMDDVLTVAVSGNAPSATAPLHMVRVD